MKDKYLLSIKEATERFGIGSTNLRKLVKNNPDADWWMSIGVKIMIKNDLFEDFLRTAKSI